MNKKLYVTYDGRGDDGQVMEAGYDKTDALKHRSDYGEDCQVWEYDLQDDDRAINGRRIDQSKGG